MSDSQKIIFCTNMPFNKRDYKRFGFDLLISEGFRVCVLEFTPIFNIDVYNSHVPADQIEYNDHYLIKKESDYYKIIEEMKKNSVFIMLFSQTNKTKFIYKYLNENKIVFGKLILGFIPEPKRPFIEKIILVFKFPELIINKFKFFSNENHSINPNFYLVGGSIFNKLINQDNIKIIQAHSFDYDNYLNQESKESKRIINDEYIVFLDEYVPFHPDYLYEKINPYCSPQDYYPELNTFFDKIEKKHNAKVVIACHPRSNYKIEDNFFNNRTLINHETENLIKYSKFVISHGSTAVSYAILYEKPILTILANHYGARFKREIRFQSSLIGSKLVDISKKQNLSNLELQLDRNKYINYKNKYIKSPDSPNKYIWKIFAENIHFLINK